MTETVREAPGQAGSGTRGLPRLVSQVFDRLMAGLHAHLVVAGYDDLRPTHCLNVLRLIECEGTRPVVLARRAGMTPQAMGELVTYLERRGYVRRVPDPVDRRGRVVVFADRGMAAAEVAEAFLADVESEWSHLVGAERFRDMLRVLAEILDSTARPSASTTERGWRRDR
ncbi:MAG TPA: MarR family winged helix-turn-helix transcriptional regulator [Actinopolymorphaceae bacterium]